MALDIVILAAGKGTRMRSNKPKVLHRLAGKTLLGHVIDTALGLKPESITVVVGHEADRVKEEFNHLSLNFAMQKEQLGTGHAVKQALEYVKNDNDVLILYGDVPLIQLETLQQLLSLGASVSLLTAELSTPVGYGRIVRKNGYVQAIVEQKDASKDELEITEINTGIMAVKADTLNQYLPRLSSDNAQKEYYLTDLIAMSKADNIPVEAVKISDFEQTLGVNDRIQLAEVERIYRHNQASSLMKSGVTLVDPARLDVRGKLVCGSDVIIEPNVIFEGDVYLADGVLIEANCIIRDTKIAEHTIVYSHSIIEQSNVGKDVKIGPYARIRPQTRLEDGSKVGNFVEIKKSAIGKGAKVNHLSYVGDSDIGSKANIGAGTITCNYDGENKYKTTIGDGAFVGSNSALVAPVSIGAKATVAAGSTVTKNVPENALVVARSKQFIKENWK